MEISNNSLIKAKELCKAGDYNTARAILESLHRSDNPPLTSFHAGSLLLTCYQKLSLWDLAIKLGSELCSLDNCWQSIKLSYAWVIYFYLTKSSNGIGLEETIIKIETMENLLEQDPTKLPLVMTILYLVSKNTALDSNLCVRLLEKLQISSLRACTNSQRLKTENALSFEEKYILAYSKALFAAEQYQKCKAFCQSCLDHDCQLSAKNRIWILRRLALSLFKTGEPNQAHLIYQQLFLQQPDWFVLFEFAQVSDSLNHNAEALQLAARAATAPGDLGMKIHLWSFLYKILQSARYYPESIQCLVLVSAIRVRNNWRLDDNLVKEQKKYNLNPQNLPGPGDVFCRLKPFFQELCLDKASHQTGVINNIMSHGKAGFIKCGAASYYFRVADVCFSLQLLAPGLKVSFCLQKSFDPKKQIESQVAVAIKVVD